MAIPLLQELPLHPVAAAHAGIGARSTDPITCKQGTSMFVRRLAMAATVLALVGCAAGVKHAEIENRQYLSTQPAKRVTISLNDEAKTKVGENLTFNQNVLLDHVKRALTAKSLLDEAQAESGNSIEIVVKDFRVRSNFSAVMFGIMAGNDHITGDVIFKDGSGKELNRFEVSASYALGGVAGGQNDARMGWLYEKFAELTVDNLSGPQK
jgi:hypothetical protein